MRTAYLLGVIAAVLMIAGAVGWSALGLRLADIVCENRVCLAI